MFVRGRLALVAATALIGSMSLASPAAATDASIKAAWDANDPAFAKLGKEERRQFAVWKRSGNRKKAGLLETITAARSLLRTNTRAIRAQPESTPTGARAKRFALASNASFDKCLALTHRGVRLISAGKKAAGNRRFAAADRYLAKSTRQSKAAKRLFRQVL